MLRAEEERRRSEVDALREEKHRLAAQLEADARVHASALQEQAREASRAAEAARRAEAQWAEAQARLREAEDLARAAREEAAVGHRSVLQRAQTAEHEAKTLRCVGVLGGRGGGGGAWVGPATRCGGWVGETLYKRSMQTSKRIWNIRMFDSYHRAFSSPLCVCREELQQERAARASAEAKRDVLQASLQKAEERAAELQLRVQARALEGEERERGGRGLGAGAGAGVAQGGEPGSEAEAELRAKVRGMWEMFVPAPIPTTHAPHPMSPSASTPAFTTLTPTPPLPLSSTA